MNKNIYWKSVLPLGVSLFVLPAVCGSQVVFDGTTREAGAGPAAGPTFVIDETDGLVRGNTLVHSFSEFSIDNLQDQSATFTGGDNITLLLNRVTGSEPSTINGVINSDLINADFYFLNPNGVIFGPGAIINVPGAFTVSTASGLNIDGENAFDVNGDIANSTLTIADPERLTFIFDNQPQPSSITLESGANLNFFDDVTLVSSAINSESETNGVGEVIGVSLTSFGGTLSLGTSDSQFSFDPASVSSPSGEIRLTDASITAGNIEGREGTVRIIGGELVMDGGNLTLLSSAEPSQLTATGDIELTNGYSVNLQPLNTALEPGLQPDVGGIVFDAANILINAGSSVSTSTFDEINGLPLNLNAGNIQLTGGSAIGSNTFGAGRGGDINISAAGSLLMAGRGEVFGSLIRAATADLPITGEVGASLPPGFGEGDGGVIRVSANDIQMQDGALISSFAAETDDVLIGRVVQTGNAGDILLNANRLSLTGNSVIETLAEESAGGNVDIRIAEATDILNSTIRADAQGALPDNPGADILINTDSLSLQSATLSANAAGGNGGNITIITNRLSQDPATSITASGIVRIEGDNSNGFPDGLLNEDAGNDIEDIEEEAFSRTTVFPDVTKLLSQRCSAANLTDRSSFVVSDDKPKAAPTSYELAQVGEGHSEARLNLMASCFY